MDAREAALGGRRRAWLGSGLGLGLGFGLGLGVRVRVRTGGTRAVEAERDARRLDVHVGAVFEVRDRRLELLR